MQTTSLTIVSIQFLGHLFGISAVVNMIYWTELCLSTNHKLKMTEDFAVFLRRVNVNINTKL